MNRRWIYNGEVYKSIKLTELDFFKYIKHFEDFRIYHYPSDRTYLYESCNYSGSTPSRLKLLVVDTYTGLKHFFDFKNCGVVVKDNIIKS